MIGIIVFVGIPLPTTGSWRAAALASILKVRLKEALLGIFIGNAISGIIMLTVSMYIARGSVVEITMMVLIIITMAVFIFYKKNKVVNNKVKFDCD